MPVVMPVVMQVVMPVVVFTCRSASLAATRASQIRAWSLREM